MIAQQVYSIALIGSIMSLTLAVLSLKREYEMFRKDIVKVIAGLGIMVKNGSKGMTIHICKTEERKETERK